MAKTSVLALGSLSAFLVVGASHGKDLTQSWVCKGDQAAGFATPQNGRSWTLRAFPTDRYVVARVKDSAIRKYPGYRWEVRRFGAPESAVLVFCKSGFDQKVGDLECSEGMGARFLFNRKSLRFTLFSQPAGYINSGVGDLGDLFGPTMEIGRCSPV
jgi:hypothetical protein